MLTVAILLDILMLIALAGTIGIRLKLTLNSPAFMAQIQKLVHTNSIDRAIRLCNAAPSALLSRLVRTLLLRANRPQELHLMFEESRYQSAQAQAKLGKGMMGVQLLGIVGTVSLSYLIYLAAPQYDRTLMAWLIGAYVVVYMVVIALMTNTLTNLADCPVYLVQVRNLLYLRAGVVPASHQPRPETTLSAEELAAWKASLDKFNQDYEVRKRAFDLVADPQTEYDQKADSNGILPPL